jgi:tRNA(Ile)-lysidine synthase
MDPKEKVSSTIRKHHMLSGGEKILIGLSGGPDSVCLTRILKKLSQKLNLSLHALYIDHGLRPEEIPKESGFCEEFCKGLEIPFDTESVDVKSFAETNRMNKQEAARELRYRVLQMKAEEIKADRIALGHTLDDQVETFLMRMIRGSGMRGLSGIPPVRGNIIRPLIELEREEIEAFLHREGIDFVVDSSNLEDYYLRNRIRSKLIPVLKELNSDVMKSLSHTTEVFREEDQYMEFAVNKAMIKLISRKTDLSIELFLMPLETMDRVLLRRILRRSVEETKGLRGIGLVHIEDIVQVHRFIECRRACNGRHPQ